MTDWPSFRQSLLVRPIARLPDQLALEDEAVTPRPDLGEVYEAEVSYVWSSLRRLGVPDRDLEDVCHDVFVVFHRTLDAFDPTRPLRPWLFGICYRVCSDYRKRAFRRREVLSEDDRAVSARTAEEAVAAAEAHALVHRALAVLPLDRRAVFILHELEGLSMPEIAQVIDAPLNTLYSRLRLAREQFAGEAKRLLRRDLAREEEA